MIDKSEFINLAEVAKQLGEEKMDKRTVKLWLKENNVKIEKIGGQLKVSLMCFRLAKERIVVDSLKYLYNDNWTNVYDLVAEDEKLKKVMLQINDKDIVATTAYTSKYFNL